MAITMAVSSQLYDHSLLILYFWMLHAHKIWRTQFSSLQFTLTVMSCQRTAVTELVTSFPDLCKL